MDSEIRVLEVSPFFTRQRPRMPLKFGRVVMDAVWLCHVRAKVENRLGRVAEGWGAIFLSDVWAWPSARVAHLQREQVMCQFVRAWCECVGRFKPYAHPMDIFWTLEPELDALAGELSTRLALAEPMPRLAALVCASPVDAALHDAFGHANGISTWRGYGAAHMRYDLSRYLGDEYRGSYPADFLSPMPEWIDAFHLVGGLDKLRETEITDEDPADGLPVSLDQWIRFEHLHCLKVKLNGRDLGWDLDRILAVAAVAHEEHRKLGLKGLFLTADTNEQCESPEYMVELLTKLRERAPAVFEALLYVEQPCERDLARRMLDVRALAALKPVVIDEALTSLADFELAMRLGYSGVALKTCKCQSAELVMAAKAARMGIPYTVQDLTNPGIALVHSVALAGHLRPIRGVEANSRQFFPDASEPERAVHPGLFRLHDGKIGTSTIRGTGLGYQWTRIGRRFDPAS